jgi:hypothetical protein
MTEIRHPYSTARSLDQRVRLAAFAFLREQERIHGETLPWPLLLQGFQFEGRRVPLVSQQGIFKPAILPEIPLTLRTAPEIEGRARPYEDSFSDDGTATAAPTRDTVKTSASVRQWLAVSR